MEGTEASKIFKVHIYGIPSSGFETLLYSDLIKLFNFSVLQFSHLLNKRRINGLSYRIIVKNKWAKTCKALQMMLGIFQELIFITYKLILQKLTFSYYLPKF